MKQESLSITDKKILSVILLIAAILRLWDLGAVPFMHDEFSALYRTSYDNFSDLLKEGVMINDSHPAGVQIFLYMMVKAVGWNEFWLKLPFALLGIASVFLVFKIGQQWFNTKVGLFSAAIVTVSELFIFYSQLIRPYSPGLFFVLLFVFFWNKILFVEEKPSVSTCIGFALAAFLSSQMHNFSLAQAGLIWLSGLFFLDKNNKTRVKSYAFSSLGALALFLPMSYVFYYQLFVRGGIGGWLSMPEMTFLIDFLQYTLNYSWLFIFVFVILVIFPFLTNKALKDNKWRLRIFGLLWFIVPFAVAMLYSKMKEPILQFSTLIFGFPFFVIVLFSFYDELKLTLKEQTAITASILIVGIISLITDRQYYKQVYNQGFDQIAVQMKNNQEKYGDSVAFVSYSNMSFMTKFYQDKEGVTNNYFFDKSSELNEFKKMLSDMDVSMLGIGLSDNGNIMWEMAALAYFPEIVEEKQWFNTRYLLLSKKSSASGHSSDEVLKVMKSDVEMRSEYGCSFVMEPEGINDIDNIGFIAELQAVDTVKEVLLVTELIDKREGSVLLWRGIDNAFMDILPGETYYLTNGFYIDSNKYDKENVKIKVYIWNKSKDFVIVKNIFSYKYKNEPHFLGLYEPLN